MLDKLEIALREEIIKSDKRTLVWFFITVAMTTGFIATAGLYFGRVSDSRLIVNCGSFISSADATTFANSHVEFKKRLNPKNKPEACSSYNYGTAN